VQLAGAGVLSLAEVRVWGADSLMATQAVDVRWLVADQLGTPRMVLDKTGSLAGMTRHDYLPFGDEAPTGWGGRTPERGYVADNVRQKFTGYERDAETGLDYARARYYASSLGRFISPDPLMSSGKATAPQSWNRYAYCLNSPLDMADPDGLMWVYRDGGNGIWYLRWINGSLSASMQRRGWRAYQGPKRLQLANRNGFADLKNGYAEVWLGPNMQMKNTGQGYADMAAGLADSVPGANWVRHKVGILRYAREDSGEYQNTKVIATGVGAAKAAKGLAAAGAAAYHALKSLADDAAKAADDAAEMVYHGTTASETVTTKGLNLADNIAAAGGDDLANEGFSVTTRLDDARGFARGRSLLRGEDPVVLGARRADLDSVLHSRVPGITLDPGELRILRKDFKRVGPGVFRRIE
jgi:RHS repeat-associated protein